ncbi:hypothetical protein NTD80_17020 [Pseudomonas sp. 13B_2.1_Bac1]|uniref:hypothetical protein n=1 Tax=Pseudomonas sp. 13B_2.1_Bac1 TaxID=2971624 RepID=UPI0021C7672E|nr:hypothetical protein [Pseudomonas sp. 13B_2.1_Bac1]MCU1784456.1 hypothetical protein [Pseudomonas sp. 13B_2.1_Bac1]
MDIFFEFFKSDIGLAISWICTVGSVAFGFFKLRENKKLKVKIKRLEVNVNKMGNDSVSQSGGGNIYTKQNSGGMNIKM